MTTLPSFFAMQSNIPSSTPCPDAASGFNVTPLATSPQRNFELIVLQQPLRAKCWGFGSEKESGKTINPPVILQLACQDNFALSRSLERLGDAIPNLVSYVSLVNDSGEDCTHMLSASPTNSTGSLNLSATTASSSDALDISKPTSSSHALGGSGDSDQPDILNSTPVPTPTTATANRTSSIPVVTVGSYPGSGSPTQSTSVGGSVTTLSALSALSIASSKPTPIQTITANMAPLVALPTRIPPSYNYWRPQIPSASPPLGIERTLDGVLVSPSNILTDLDGRRGVFFVFVEILIRVEGTYRLKFDLHDLASLNAKPGPARSLASAYTKSFISYNARDYMNLQQQAESSELSKHFAEQGLIIPIRKTARKKRGYKSLHFRVVVVGANTVIHSVYTGVIQPATAWSEDGSE
ncbi:hypothetical protein SeMB42_g00997 [Synchytrium endobioticum]|nr:hypothetical protein SeMB42_g00997 [Synchytrium endobioticum]